MSPPEIIFKSKLDKVRTKANLTILSNHHQLIKLTVINFKDKKKYTIINIVLNFIMIVLLRLNKKLHNMLAS